MSDLTQQAGPADERHSAIHRQAEPTAEDLRVEQSRAGEFQAEQARALASGRLEALSPDGLLLMQQQAGNAAVAQSLAHGAQQGSVQPPVQQGGVQPPVQQGGVQRSAVHDIVDRSSGQPIPSDIVRTVESAYGPLPADARMHTDHAALASAHEIGAYAYASGRDIVIPADAPREIQLEEALHLAQQRVHTDVAQTDLGNGVLVSDDNDRYEREAQDLARQPES